MISTNVETAKNATIPAVSGARKMIDDEEETKVIDIRNLNYRVIKNVGQYDIGIFTVYYDTSGNITSWSETPIELCFNDLDDLREEIDNINKALEKPTLEEVRMGGRDVLVTIF